MNKFAAFSKWRAGPPHQLFDGLAAANAARFSTEVTPALPTAVSIAITPTTTSNPSLVATK
jgi:hypothetical protein